MTAQNEAAGEGYFQISDKKPICAVEASGGEAEAGAAESSRRITAEYRHYDEILRCFNSGVDHLWMISKSNDNGEVICYILTGGRCRRGETHLYFALCSVNLFRTTTIQAPGHVVLLG